MKLTALRVSLASVLLVAAATSLRPHMTSYVSTSALVNARVITVPAPFSGIIETESPRVSSPVHEGDTLFVLRNARTQEAELEGLKAELGGISGEIVGLEKQINDLDALSRELTDRRDAKIAAREKWFSPRLDEARWDVRKAEAHLLRTEGINEQLKALSDNGNTSVIELIDAQANLEMAEADLEKKRAALRRVEIEEGTLDGALGVDMISSDFEQTEYRIDEIAIRRADLDARLLGLQTRRAALKRQTSEAELESIRQATFSPKSAKSGLIWNPSDYEGAHVAEGQKIIEVLDCSFLFLEVILPERHFEKVPVGTKAWVKLKGSSSAFTAEVLAAYGSGARPNRVMGAARSRIEANNGVRVIVGIGEPDISSKKVQRSFCDVGRSAEVRFVTDNNVFSIAKSYFLKLFGASTQESGADLVDTPANPSE